MLGSPCSLKTQLKFIDYQFPDDICRIRLVFVHSSFSFFGFRGSAFGTSCSSLLIHPFRYKLVFFCTIVSFTALSFSVLRKTIEKERGWPHVRRYFNNIISYQFSRAIVCFLQVPRNNVEYFLIGCIRVFNIIRILEKPLKRS